VDHCREREREREWEREWEWERVRESEREREGHNYEENKLIQMHSCQGQMPLNIISYRQKVKPIDKCHQINETDILMQSDNKCSRWIFLLHVKNTLLCQFSELFKLFRNEKVRKGGYKDREEEYKIRREIGKTQKGIIKKH